MIQGWWPVRRSAASSAARPRHRSPRPTGLTATEPDGDPPVVEHDGNAGPPRIQRAAEVGDDGGQDTEVFGPLRPWVGRPELVGQDPSEHGRVVVSRPDRLVPWVLRRSALHRTDVLIPNPLTQGRASGGLSSPVGATGRPRGTLFGKLATCATSRARRDRAPVSHPGPCERRPDRLTGVALAGSDHDLVGSANLLPFSSGIRGSGLRLGRRRCLKGGGWSLGSWRRLASLRVPSETRRVLVPVHLAHPAQPILLAGLARELRNQCVVWLDRESSRADAPSNVRHDPSSSRWGPLIWRSDAHPSLRSPDDASPRTTAATIGRTPGRGLMPPRRTIDPAKRGRPAGEEASRPGAAWPVRSRPMDGPS